MDVTGIERVLDSVYDSVVLDADQITRSRCIVQMKPNNMNFDRYTAANYSYMRYMDDEIGYLQCRSSFTLQEYVDVVVDSILC